MKYLTKGFELPTPAVKVQLVHPDTKVKATVIARIDSGADITTIPFVLLEKLNLTAVGWFKAGSALNLIGKGVKQK